MQLLALHANESSTRNYKIQLRQIRLSIICQNRSLITAIDSDPDLSRVEYLQIQQQHFLLSFKNKSDFFTCKILVCCLKVM